MVFFSDVFSVIYSSAPPSPPPYSQHEDIAARRSYPVVAKYRQVGWIYRSPPARSWPAGLSTYWGIIWLTALQHMNYFALRAGQYSYTLLTTQRIRERCMRKVRIRRGQVCASNTWDSAQQWANIYASYSLYESIEGSNVLRCTGLGPVNTASTCTHH